MLTPNPDRYYHARNEFAGLEFLPPLRTENLRMRMYRYRHRTRARAAVALRSLRGDELSNPLDERPNELPHMLPEAMLQLFPSNVP